MKCCVTIVCRPTPKGLVVIVPGFAGSRKFGEIGERLDTLRLLLIARAAATQGLGLLLEVQSDGVPEFPSNVPAEWAGEAEA